MSIAYSVAVADVGESTHPGSVLRPVRCGLVGTDPPVDLALLLQRQREPATRRLDQGAVWSAAAVRDPGCDGRLTRRDGC